MSMDLRTIYAAVTDDVVFRDLARTLADEIGAASGIIHWRCLGSVDPDHFYTSGFSMHGRRSLSAGQHASINGHAHANRDGDRHVVANGHSSPFSKVWDLERLVPQPVSEDSVIYNDWVGAIAQDYHYCLGGVFERDGFVLELGFFRDRSGSEFAMDALERVQALGEPILHMIMLRQQLAEAHDQQRQATSAADALGTALFKLTPSGRILYCNAAARALLIRADGLIERAGRLLANDLADRQRLTDALAMSGADWLRHATAIRIRRTSGGHYALSLLPITSNGHRRIVATLRDPDHFDQSVAPRLRALFGLSAAEGEIAAALAAGSTLADIATERGTSVGTVRGQIKAITSKLGCRRQSEIVAIVGALPTLNPPHGVQDDNDPPTSATEVSHERSYSVVN